MKHALFVFTLVVTLLLPAAPRVAADGLPFAHLLDLLVLFGLVFVFYILAWRPRSSWPVRRLVAALLVLAVLRTLGATWALPHGLIGSYYPKVTDWSGEPAQSIAFPTLEGTRIDRQLNFKDNSFSFRRPPFPLWFINDTDRFNWYRPQYARSVRETMPFR